LKHIGFLKADTLISILNGIGIPFVIIYVICMFIVPWITAEGEWVYVQKVWHSWQSLNVSLLAFIASLIAFNIARYNAEKKRSREFVAARAFLPEALSELNTYFSDCSLLLVEAFKRKSKGEREDNTPLSKPVPQLPTSYREIFS